MKEKIKKVYVSETGIEFDTKLECLLSELNQKQGLGFSRSEMIAVNYFLERYTEKILKVLSEKHEDVVKKLEDEYIALNTGDVIQEGDEFLNDSTYEWQTTNSLYVGDRVAWDDIYRRKK